MKRRVKLQPYDESLYNIYQSENSWEYLEKCEFYLLHTLVFNEDIRVYCHLVWLSCDVHLRIGQFVD